MKNYLDKISVINQLLKEASDQEIVEQYDTISVDIAEISKYIEASRLHVRELIEKMKNIKTQAELEIIQSKIEEIRTTLPELKQKYIEYNQLCKNRFKMHQIGRVKEGITDISDQPSAN